MRSAPAGWSPTHPAAFAMAGGGAPGPRSAEHAARRTSSCAFAENLASAAIAARDAAVAALPEPARARALAASRGQTVLAAVVARDARRDPLLRVVALGSGTKFLRAADVDADANVGERVRDCHAEVLARRAFKRFLYHQMAVCAEVGDAPSSSTAPARASSSSSSSSSSSPWHVLERVTSPSPRGAFRVAAGVDFHLYVSSAPCGNATVKRWAKGARATSHETLGAFEIPPGAFTHDRPSFGATKDGQLAFLYKRDGGGPPSEAPAGPSADSAADFERAERDGSVSVGSPRRSPPHLSVVPPGTATTGRILTCSDKLAVWSCVGLQGALLLSPGMLAEPAYLASVCVGRKFNAAILKRALCCRMRPFDDRDHAAKRQRRRGGDDDADETSAPAEASRARNSAAASFSLTHPAVLCCATPLDGGLSSYAPGQGATFDDVALTSWYTGGEGSDAAAEALDGRTGKSLGAARGAGVGGAPGTSRKALLEVHRRALAAFSSARGGEREGVEEGAPIEGGEGDGPPGYRAMKAFAAAGSGYGAAKRAAMATKGVWSLSTPKRASVEDGENVTGVCASSAAR